MNGGARMMACAANLTSSTVNSTSSAVRLLARRSLPTSATLGAYSLGWQVSNRRLRIEIYGTWAETAGSICLDAHEPDHLAPLLGFVGDVLAEVGGRADKRRGSHVGKPRLDLGISEARI